MKNEKKKPIETLPVSPIKIFAGCQFLTKIPILDNPRPTKYKDSMLSSLFK